MAEKMTLGAIRKLQVNVIEKSGQLKAGGEPGMTWAQRQWVA